MKCAYFRFSTPQETYRRNYERLYSLSLEGVRNYFSDHVQQNFQCYAKYSIFIFSSQGAFLCRPKGTASSCPHFCEKGSHVPK